jgi:large subunit ribosomal protein L28
MRECIITGKKKRSGNKRSHSMIATKRSWGVNLQKKVTIVVNGKSQIVRVSARGLRTLRKQQA